jgi:hypothetical protein
VKRAAKLARVPTVYVNKKGLCNCTLDQNQMPGGGVLLVSGARQAGSLTKIVHTKSEECKLKTSILLSRSVLIALSRMKGLQRVQANPDFAGTMPAVNPRVIVSIAVLIVIVVIAFVAMRPASPTASPAPASSSPEATKPSSTEGVNVNIPERTLEGVVETPSPLSNPHVAALIGSQVIAQAPIKDDTYTLTLPGKLGHVALTDLENVQLPNGDGRLKGDGAIGVAVKFVAFDDVNNNTQPDPNETSVNLAPFKAGQSEAMRGFFKYGLVIVSKASSLKETQDHPTGAKGFYRYNLEFPAGWHMIEGEFASQGYDIRESTGDKFDLIVSRIPSGKGPAGFEK